MGQRRRTVVVVLVALLAGCPCASALNPSLDVFQYAHTAWRVREGFSKGSITAIAQTSDGYLWLGTEFGLLRFDGVRAVPWLPPPGQALPDNQITRLLVTRDGTLWIATRSGLASWDGATLVHIKVFAGQLVLNLFQDRDGSVWVGTLPMGVPRKLCGITKNRVTCDDGGGRFATGVSGLYQDKRGNLWVGVNTGVWRWTPGPPEFHAVAGEINGVRGMAEDEGGPLVIAVRGGTRRLVAGNLQPNDPFPGNAQRSQSTRILRDRDGGFWIGTSSAGLVHRHQGRTEVFTGSDGLSNDDVFALFEDREGSVWAATSGGLDRFRESAVVSVSTRQGLTNSSVTSVLPVSDGSMWIGTVEGLHRWRDGEVTVYRARGSQIERGRENVREIVGRGFPEHGVHHLFRDDRGRMWVASRQGVGYLEGERFIASALPEGGNIAGMSEAAGRTLWIANTNVGLFRLSERGDVDRIPWSQLGHRDPAYTLVADRSRSGVWLGFSEGGIAYYENGEIRRSLTAADGLGGGGVTDLRLDSDGALWAATVGGLSRVKGGRISTLTTKNGLPCDTVHWMADDEARALWLHMSCGLVRIARPELAAWIAAVDNPPNAPKSIRTTAFDGSDGVTSQTDIGNYGPHVARAADGRLWFSDLDGVSIVDPSHVPFNKVAPPVQIEQVVADRKTYDVTSATAKLGLPPLIRDLQIDYTALSLVAPERNRFKVKLEGWDRDWQDVGNRRQAFYNSLPPRSYRFRVIASNNSGVWNEAGALLDFTIAPAYYQTRWFDVLVVGACLTLLWVASQYRVRRVAREFDLRLEERVNERTRIARDLHDTLLQSFHGLLFGFQAVDNMLPARPSEAKQKLARAIEQAALAITEGRDAVQNLRSTLTDDEDLAESISTLGRELAAAHEAGNGSRPTIDVAVEGTPRVLHPILRDDIYRIAGEAVRNAFRHAHARHIEVEVRYGGGELQVRVGDDGQGIDPAVLSTHRSGHFGLPGMRERAEVLGGHLNVWSRAGIGTEIVLAIPGAAAYASPRPPSRFRWLARRKEARS